MEFANAHFILVEIFVQLSGGIPAKIRITTLLPSPQPLCSKEWDSIPAQPIIPISKTGIWLNGFCALRRSLALSACPLFGTIRTDYPDKVGWENSVSSAPERRSFNRSEIIARALFSLDLVLEISKANNS